MRLLRPLAEMADVAEHYARVPGMTAAGALDRLRRQRQMFRLFLNCLIRHAHDAGVWG